MFTKGFRSKQVADATTSVRRITGRVCTTETYLRLSIHLRQTSAHVDPGILWQAEEIPVGRRRRDRSMYQVLGWEKSRLLARDHGKNPSFDSFATCSVPCRIHKAVEMLQRPRLTCLLALMAVAIITATAWGRVCVP